MHATEIRCTLPGGGAKTELFTAYHDGDIAAPGSCTTLNLPSWRVELGPDSTCNVQVPFDVIAALAAKAVRDKMIADLEDAEGREVLAKAVRDKMIADLEDAEDREVLGL